MPEEPTCAVVTGAARGIGKAIAERFEENERFDVVACIDVDETVYDVAAGLEGGRGYQVDVRDQDAVYDVIADVEDDARIVALVNNAGISQSEWVGDLDEEDWHRVIDVNLTGQYNLIHVAAPMMFERGEGYVVNISSGAGQTGSVSGGVHYSASKAGILGLTKGCAKQLSPHLQVNCVVPGLVDTRLAYDDELWSKSDREEFIESLPLERFGKPDEIARVVEFLCGDGAEYMTGSVVTVDGGSNLV